MNGYKTGGDWTDVTSIARNEVVFEGRHKEYGAYYIRKRYPNALYFSFFSALTFIALCAYVPYSLRNISPVIPKPTHDFTVKPKDLVIPITPSQPHATPPHVNPPKSSPNLNAVPLVVEHIDSAPKQHVVDNNIVAVPGKPTPGDSGQGIAINTGAGTVGPPTPPQLPSRIFNWVSKMPKFPGGNVETYIGGQIRYSAEDVQLGIQGTVYASFVVEKDGSVSSVKILRGISGGPDLDAEAIRVLSEMPKWTPGEQDGHPVRVGYTIPIQFKLQ